MSAFMVLIFSFGLNSVRKIIFMKMKLKYFILFMFTTLLQFRAVAQLTGWQYISIVEIAEQQGVNSTDEQFLLHINTEDLIANGLMKADGSDIRFATDCEGNNLIPFYIDPSTLNSDSTEVWVLVPQVSAFSITEIYFFSGNAAAINASDQI